MTATTMTCQPIIGPQDDELEIDLSEGAGPSRLFTALDPVASALFGMTQRIEGPAGVAQVFVEIADRLWNICGAAESRNLSAPPPLLGHLDSLCRQLGAGRVQLSTLRGVRAGLVSLERTVGLSNDAAFLAWDDLRLELYWPILSQHSRVVERVCDSADDDPRSQARLLVAAPSAPPHLFHRRPTSLRGGAFVT